MHRTLAFLFLACWIASPCSGENKNTRKEYIQKFSKIAIQEMRRTGIPASVKMAQGILESGAGTSSLAQTGNNHFGIKCHDWGGPTVTWNDNKQNECFRKYSSPEESWTDHSLFLTSRQRYAPLFQLKKTDYKGWARGLQKAGYATNPSYAERLIRIIEDEKLYLLDRGKETSGAAREYTLNSSSTRVNYRQRMTRVNGIPCIETRKGDSFAAIAAYFNIPLRKLLEYNDKNETSIRAGMNVFLKAKKNKAARTRARHKVKEGETAYWISQMYGVKFSRLLYFNGLAADEKLLPGETLSLRKYNDTL
ncbi:MAG: glucosaminidase domain-containing protein [Odoribacteraceae bacterium]|jgi:LysM repeat protein|nr:glucosaminidase domain-containing protein [Odoribacteraceae bacterium]